MPPDEANNQQLATKYWGRSRVHARSLSVWVPTAMAAVQSEQESAALRNTLIRVFHWSHLVSSSLSLTSKGHWSLCNGAQNHAGILKLCSSPANYTGRNELFKWKKSSKISNMSAAEVLSQSYRLWEYISLQLFKLMPLKLFFKKKFGLLPISPGYFCGFSSILMNWWVVKFKGLVWQDKMIRRVVNKPWIRLFGREKILLKLLYSVLY